MKGKLHKMYVKILGKLAKYYLNKHKIEIIGITGSVGKTSLRSIICQTLRKHLNGKEIYTSSKNFNGELGFPLSIFQINDFSPSVVSFTINLPKIFFQTFFGSKPCDIMVLEYGIDFVGEMDFLLDIAKPNIALLTKIGKVHSMNFGTPDVIAKEKYKLIFNAKDIVFINKSDSYSHNIQSNINIDCFSFDTQENNTDTDIGFADQKYLYKNNILKNNFIIIQKNKKIFDISINLLGNETCSYVSIAFTILDILNYKYHNISFFEENKGKSFDMIYEQQPGRLNIFKGINDSIIFDSSYNSEPESMRIVINNIYKIKNIIFPKYKLILFLGDMRELGDFTEQEHRKLAAYISQTADKVYLVGESTISYTYDELGKIGFDMDLIEKNRSSRKLGEKLKNYLNDSQENTIVLFKGSQNTIYLEEAIKYILADPQDSVLLARQSDWWLKRKREFFNKIL